MTTIKSYTDISQSKKLAEILPLESADMWYSIVDNGAFICLEQHNEYEQIPCWSLASLLNVLPPYLFEFDKGIDLNVYPHLNGRGWNCSYMQNCAKSKETNKFRLITNGDSLVDACVAMVEKLHELKML